MGDDLGGLGSRAELPSASGARITDTAITRSPRCRAELCARLSAMSASREEVRVDSVGTGTRSFSRRDVYRSERTKPSGLPARARFARSVRVTSRCGGHDFSRARSAEPWQTVFVANRFPVRRRDAHARGAHEVIIETARARRGFARSRRRGDLFAAFCALNADAHARDRRARGRERDRALPQSRAARRGSSQRMRNAADSSPSSTVPPHTRRTRCARAPRSAPRTLDDERRGGGVRARRARIVTFCPTRRRARTRYVSLPPHPSSGSPRRRREHCRRSHAPRPHAQCAGRARA